MGRSYRFISKIFDDGITETEQRFRRVEAWLDELDEAGWEALGVPQIMTRVYGCWFRTKTSEKEPSVAEVLSDVCEKVSQR